nr:MAG TPA: hypothetical protein [Bacteriophage sp.]
MNYLSQSRYLTHSQQRAWPYFLALNIYSQAYFGIVPAGLGSDLYSSQRLHWDWLNFCRIQFILALMLDQESHHLSPH